jgi:predicted nucleotidyltransferase
MAKNTNLPASVQSILEKVLEALHTRFGEALVCVVLFGSHVRGEAGPYSDLDLLVVAEGVPRDWRERGRMELAVEQMGLRLGKAIQVILVERDDVRFAVDTFSPLLLEIHGSHVCLWDRGGFFAREMGRFSQRLTQYRVRQLSPHVWEVPDFVTE